MLRDGPDVVVVKAPAKGRKKNGHAADELVEIKGMDIAREETLVHAYNSFRVLRDLIATGNSSRLL